jgi:hypothetical protein
VRTPDSHSIYSCISEGCWGAVFEEDKDDTAAAPVPGSTVVLVGRTAIPCVCEVPPSSASLFSAAGSKVISAGVTWQSLYLVLLGSHMILVEPDQK